jgi:hypothetical protein
MALSRWTGRAIGLDIHRDFCVVAICEDAQVRSGARGAEHAAGIGLVGREPDAVGPQYVPATRAQFVSGASHMPSPTP